MSILLFANNFTTTLSASILSTDTSATLVSTTGLPTITGDEYFVLSFFDAATGLLTEIVNVTAVVGLVITMVRAQEGTTARAWAAGDVIAEQWTAGQAAAMSQASQVQTQSTNYSVATGTANAIIAAFTPVVTTHVIGMPLRVKLIATNTAAATFNPGPSVVAITGPDGSALQAGDLISADVVTLVYNGVSYIKDPVGGNANRQGSAQAATTTETNAGTNTTKYVTPAGFQASLGAGLSGINGAIAALQALEATGVISANGYIEIPINGVGTLIVQWGTNSFTPSAIAYYNQTINFPITFPNTPFAIVATPGTTFNGGDGATGGVIDVVMIPASGMTASHFVAHGDTNASQTLSGVHTVRWIAIGF